MNEAKQQKLFEAARRAPAIEAPPNFVALVIAAVRREMPAANTPTLVDAFAALFPRFAIAAVLLIAVSVAADFYFDGGVDYKTATEQWFFGAE